VRHIEAEPQTDALRLESEFSRGLSDETGMAEECLVDDRAVMRPAEVVQMKLLRLLPSAPVPVSCLHTRRDTRR